MIQGGNFHRSPHSFAEDLGRGAVQSLFPGTRRAITRAIGTSSAEGVEITGGHLPSPAESPPLPSAPKTAGFPSRPHGTAPRPSPRQHGGQGARPGKSLAKLPGSFGTGGPCEEEAPTPSSQGTSRRMGSQPGRLVPSLFSERLRQTAGLWSKGPSGRTNCCTRCGFSLWGSLRSGRWGM